MVGYFMHVAHIQGDVMPKRLNPSLSDRQTPGGLVWTFAGRLESWIGDVTGWQFTSSIVWRGCNVMRLLQIDSAWPRSTPQCFDKFRRIGETWNSIKGVGGMVSFSLFNFAYHRFCIWYGSWNITSFCASFFCCCVLFISVYSCQMMVNNDEYIYRKKQRL